MSGPLGGIFFDSHCRRDIKSLLLLAVSCRITDADRWLRALADRLELRETN